MKGAVLSFFLLANFLNLNTGWADAMVQILGDGQRDLLKHLFTANLFFDFALIAVIKIGIVLFLQSCFPRAVLKAKHLSEIYKKQSISP